MLNLFFLFIFHNSFSASRSRGLFLQLRISPEQLLQFVDPLLTVQIRFFHPFALFFLCRTDDLFGSLLRRKNDPVIRIRLFLTAAPDVFHILLNCSVSIRKDLIQSESRLRHTSRIADLNGTVLKLILKLGQSRRQLLILPLLAN